MMGSQEYDRQPEKTGAARGKGRAYLFIGERKGCSQLRYGTVFEGLTESKLWI